MRHERSFAPSQPGSLRRCVFQLAASFLCSHILAAPISDTTPLALPAPGDNQLRVLSPTLLELTLVTAKQPNPATITDWNLVDASGNFVAPALTDLTVTANGSPVSATGLGFKRRALHAPLKVRDLRLINQLYVQLGSALPAGASVQVANPSGALWSSGTSFHTTLDAYRFSPALHVS